MNILLGSLGISLSSQRYEWIPILMNESQNELHQRACWLVWKHLSDNKQGWQGWFDEKLEFKTPTREAIIPHAFEKSSERRDFGATQGNN